MNDGGHREGFEFDRWHLLFDALCNRAGHFDNARLASEYCNWLGKRGEMQFETTVRNLRNWRSGRHIPRQRNFMVLSHLLKVDRNPDIFEAWTALYAAAREMEEKTRSAPIPGSDPEPSQITTEPAPPPQPSDDPRLPAPQRQQPIKIGSLLGGLALFCGGIAAAEIYRAEPWTRLFPAPKHPLIVWRPHVSLMVGESLPIHGERGDCGKPPPDWEYVLTRLPISRIGTFSDGGIVRRNSNFCRGETPARAVVFTADKPGIEELLVLGDVMRVMVTDTPL